MSRLRSESQSHHHHNLQPAGACLSRTASSPSPSSDTNLSAAAPCWPLLMSKPTNFMNNNVVDATPRAPHNLELQLLTTTSASSSRFDVSVTSKTDEDHSTQLQLSIGSSSEGSLSRGAIMKDVDAREQLRLAMAEKAYAEEGRQQAKRQIELAEQELANAKRIRQQAQEDLEKAQAMREHAIKQINSTLIQITCHACKHKFEAPMVDHYNSSSMELSYISSSMALTEGHGQK